MDWMVRHLEKADFTVSSSKRSVKVHCNGSSLCYLLTYLLTCLLAYLLAYLLTYFLTCLLTCLLAYLLLMFKFLALVFFFFSSFVEFSDFSPLYESFF
jgi:fatty acid desaturase